MCNSCYRNTNGCAYQSACGGQRSCSTQSICTAQSTCGYQNTCGDLLNILFNRSSQSVCRDCCGNLRTNGCYRTLSPCCQTQSCCHHHCNPCCGCGCGGTGGNANDGGSTSGNGNGNGGFACFTVCGNRGFSTAQTQSTSVIGGDAYYARQYGLYPRRSGCCQCGSAQAYDAFVSEEN